MTSIHFRRPQSSVPGFSSATSTEPPYISPGSGISSPPSGHEPDHDEAIADESMRVAYVDPASVKEKRRLYEAVKKGQIAEEGERASPSKRARGRR